MAKFYGAIALTGGGTGSLDAIPSTNLVQGDGCIVITSSGEAMFYRLSSAGGQTEAAPNIIVCDDDTAKSWHIIKLVSSNIDAIGVINSSGLITAGAGLTISTGKLTASSGAQITGDSTVTGKLTISSNIEVLGAINSSGLVTAGAGLTISSGKLTASSGALITGDSTVTGKLTISSNIEVLGAINSSGLITAGNALTVSSGKLTASSVMLVSGIATFDSDVKIVGTLTATNSCSNVARWAGAAKTVSTATASGGAAGDIWFHVAS